jgi:hypothetical protein
MRHLYLSFSWLLFLIALAGSLRAQAQAPEAPRVSGNFSGLSFPLFVREIESQTSFKFYYEAAAVDSVVVQMQAQQLELAAVLEQVFRQTNLHFVIDAERRVFITKGRPLALGLPPDFFTGGAARQPAAAADPAPVGPSAPGRRQNTAEIKLHEIGTSRATPASGRATVAGYLRDIRTGEPIIGAAVYKEAPLVGTTTDQFGYYALALPPGRHELKIKGLGLKNTRRQILLHANGRLDIEMEEDITPLKEVVIEAEKDKNVAGMQMGLEKLDIKTMKQVPSAFGETDILRVVLTLPGVKSVGEGSTGLNVRGGAADQNLILFNDATIYNPAHMFGFFSAFNPDILKTVELFKSAIPARYGGRLSSVLEVTTRDGNKKTWSGAGGIGLLTSRLTLEGPLVKDKTSLLVAGRTSYSDWILGQLPQDAFRRSSASFYDLNVHVSHQMDEQNTFYATGYSSRDQFKLSIDTLYQYQNRNASAKWKHLFSQKLYGVFTGSATDYRYAVTSDKNPGEASRLDFALNQFSGQADFSFFPNARHTVDFGVSTIFYKLAPGRLLPRGGESLVLPDVLPREQALESALYFSDRYDVSPRLSLSAGLRYSLYRSLGPREVYQYVPGVPRTVSTLTDTLRYGAGENVATYKGPEFRLSVKYMLTDAASVKASFNRLRQYIHLLSNTTSMSPTDTWKLSDAHLRPQVGDQLSLGFYKNLKNNTIEASVETYYKTMHDFVDYKSGASLLLNHHLETDVINAEGQAYGVEVMMKKMTGKINGWVSYTWSRSLVRIPNPGTAEVINGGAYYPSNFDKPHDFTLIGNYRFSRRFSTSLNVTYSTGRPITLPLAVYEMGNTQRVYYSDRNQYRVPDYFRMDFAMNMEGNHKVKKLAHSSWTLGIYNLTGRHNPYSVYFKSEAGRIKGYKLSIFGRPIPNLTYNFKF